MVDALGEMHRVLKPGGTLVDARPDSRVLGYAEHVTPRGFVRVGTIRTAREELKNDRASDHAIATVVRRRLFRHGPRGRLWHRVPFEDLDALRQYLSEHLRFEKRARWTIDAATRRRIRGDRFVIRRGVRYELLERLPGTR